MCLISPDTARTRRGREKQKKTPPNPNKYCRTLADFAGRCRTLPDLAGQSKDDILDE